MNSPLDAAQQPNSARASPDDVVLRRLLLGKVDDVERVQLEEAYFTSVEAFDRLVAVEEELADEYVAGTLSPDDREAFERHFAVTPAGRRRLRTAQAFHGALAELAAHSLPHGRRVRLGFKSRALAVAAIILVAALVSFLMLEVRRLSQRAAGWQAERIALLEQQDVLRREVDVLRNRTAQVADSRAEFSCTQGRDNWYYGYYDGPFHTGDFRLMAQCVEDTYYGPGFSWWVDPSRFWTSIGPAVWFPNGPQSCGRQAVEQWPVRRWISEVSGAVIASGTVRTLLGEFDGYIAHILVDGKSIWSFTAPPGSSTTPPLPFRTTFSVDRGTPVDFAIQPRWSDCNDHAEFLITIGSDAPLQPAVRPVP
jgi:hypothetical protein